MRHKMTPAQAQFYQRRRFARAIEVRLNQVLGNPSPGFSPMVKPVKPGKSSMPPGKKR